MRRGVRHQQRGHPGRALARQHPDQILENNPMHSSGMIDVSAWPAARPAGDTQCPDVFRTSTCKGRRCHAERQKPPRLSRVRPSRMRRRQLRPIRFGSNCNWSIPSRRPSRHRQRDQERGRSPASRQGRLRQPYQAAAADEEADEADADDQRSVACDYNCRAGPHVPRKSIFVPRAMLLET